MEVLIALAIFAVGILGVASMQLESTNGNSSARRHTEASEYNQATIENMMATVPYTSLADDTTSSTTNADGYTVTWTVNDSGDSDIGMYIITVTVDDPRGNRISSFTFVKTQNT